MDYTKLSMTPAQCAKFDKHIVSTRIRAGRSVDTLALPPSTDRKQRRTVESLLVTALAGMQGLSMILYTLRGKAFSDGNLNMIYLCVCYLEIMLQPCFIIQFIAYH